MNKIPTQRKKDAPDMVAPAPLSGANDRVSMKYEAASEVMDMKRSSLLYKSVYSALWRC